MNPSDFSEWKILSPDNATVEEKVSAGDTQGVNGR